MKRSLCTGLTSSLRRRKTAGQMVLILICFVQNARFSPCKVDGGVMELCLLLMMNRETFVVAIKTSMQPFVVTSSEMSQ